MNYVEGKPVRILCVEDHPSLREMLVLTLELVGYQVTSAENGKLGVEIARQWQPDLILMDFRMPVMNGPEAVRTLRGDSITKHIPIFMLSAYGDAATRSRCLEAGADKYFTKPLDLAQLELAIEHVVNKVSCVSGRVH